MSAHGNDRTIGMVASAMLTAVLLFAFVPAHAQYRQIDILSERSTGMAPTASYRTSPVDAPSTMSIDSTAARPGARTFLEPNAPNPFHGSTTISYSLAEETQVLLTVHDFFYANVLTLVDETQPAGRYSVTFSPSDMPSGIYFYTLRTGKGMEWGRMVHIR